MTASNGQAFEGVDVERMRSSLDNTPVVCAVLFGSRVHGAATESSDVDVALRFPDGMDDRARFQCRNRIDAELQEYADGFVDVSDLESLPTGVAHAALQEGRLIAGDDSACRAYRERIAAEYESTSDRRERERRAFIESLASGDV